MMNLENQDVNAQVTNFSSDLDSQKSSEAPKTPEETCGQNKRPLDKSKQKEKGRPPVVIDSLNKAARTILDHNEAYKTWTAADFSDSLEVMNKLNVTSHYI